MKGRGGATGHRRRIHIPSGGKRSGGNFELSTGVAPPPLRGKLQVQGQISTSTVPVSQGSYCISAVRVPAAV